MSSPTDLVALSRTEEKVAAELVALQARYGEMPPDAEYWMDVVVASHKLFALGGIDAGFRVLSIVPPSYFRGPMLEQMEVDEDFVEMGRKIADCLLVAGKAKIPNQFEIPPNVNIQRGIGRA
jgi:hypothetical protein